MTKGQPVKSDKEVLEALIADKGETYEVTVDNDNVSVWNKKTDEWAYSFNSFGSELLIEVFQFLKLDATGA